MTQNLEKVAFTINVKTRALPEMELKLDRTTNGGGMQVTKAISKHDGRRSSVYLEATGFDKLQLDSFREWAEDFAERHS
jgi:hypothetical protein